MGCRRAIFDGHKGPLSLNKCRLKMHLWMSNSTAMGVGPKRCIFLFAETDNDGSAKSAADVNSWKGVAAKRFLMDGHALHLNKWRLEGGRWMLMALRR